MPQITLYEYAPSRSARCRWALLETGLEFNSVQDGPDLVGSDRLLPFHPLKKVPAAEIDGHPLFESAAICTAIGDLVPEQNLVGPSGSRSRALHDQWVSFALSEMGCWLWNTDMNSRVLPPEKRISGHLRQNGALFRRGARVIDQLLDEQQFLIENRFTMADIIVSFTIKWGQSQGLIDDFSNLLAYLQRLGHREHSTLSSIGRV
ncbi:MAG: glutathione S-transferase family protein [Parasphingorhabdus sp.]|uniref:glutathione S-transferase family protein n=1 Tax=Parasphingorhabdus sp. TaxID=2709688 RepID=UPI0032967C6D